MQLPKGMVVVAGGGATLLLVGVVAKAIKRLEVRLWLGLRTTLSNVKVATSSLSPNDALSFRFDEEGFVACDVSVKGGKIVEVSFATKKMFDCGGAILTGCFADAHTHATKTEIVPRLRNATGSMNGAMACEVDDEVRWSHKNDIKRRMRFALDCAYHHGTKSLRTHLDGCASDNAEVRSEVWRAFDELRVEFEKKDFVLQGVANLFLPQYANFQVAQKHCDEAKRHKNVVLGAYVGNVAFEPSENTTYNLNALFSQAQRLKMDVDLHIDETNDPKCCGLLSLAASLKSARKEGFKGKVILGHCTSLSLRDDKNLVIKELASFKKDLYVIANPSTNLGLQDRRGSAEPFCTNIPEDIPRTPQWRGLTLLQELRAAGVDVCAASDNVRDHWYPYGDYDMLTVLNSAIAMGHLDTAPTEGHWVDLVTATPTRAMGLPHPFVAKGAPADLILFPSARRASELFARPQTDRIVIRKGRIQNSKLPDFKILDDLVNHKTRRTS